MFAVVSFVDRLTRVSEIANDWTTILLVGALTTVFVTFGSVVLGLLIGLFMGMFRLSKYKLFSYPAIAYIEFFRGTPLLVQIFLIYYGIAPYVVGHSVDPFITGIIICGINSGAYIAEIVRGGIESIDKGQLEAAKSLGMSHSQSMQYIILPQAFKVMIPPLINEFVAMLKDTSLISVIAVEELMRKGQLAVAVTYDPFVIWTIVALIYLAMTLPITQLGVRTERRLKTS